MLLSYHVVGIGIKVFEIACADAHLRAGAAIAQWTFRTKRLCS